jgi:sugar diacid utilization regulator
VQVLARDALDHVDDLLDVIVPMLEAAEPPGFFDEEGLSDLRTACESGLVTVLSVLAGVTEATQETLDVPRSTGRRQVQQALPLEGVLRAYRLTGQALWEHFVATARASGTPVGDALLDGASEVWRVIDLFCTEASLAYRREEGLLRERDERVQSAVLSALLEGRGADPQFARDAAHALGLPKNGPFVCVVGLADAPDQLALDNARERLRVKGVASAWATLAGSDVGVVALGSRGPSRVRELLGPAVRTRAGMSPAFTELSELPRAQHLAEVAARMPSDRRTKVQVLEEDLVAGLVVDAPLVASMLYERTIGTLLAAEGQDGPALLGTLRAFLDAAGSLNTAAANSFVHRNTMLYRLNKIEKITGLSVRSLQDQVVWVLALKELDSRR